jgi:hypothetical protein
MLLLFVAMLVFVVGLVIALVLWKFGKHNGRPMWWISVIFYLIMTIPLLYKPQFLLLVACMAGWFARVSGVGLAAFTQSAGWQPYCKISGNGFAIVYMAMGAVAAILGYLGGGISPLLWTLIA